MVLLLILNEDCTISIGKREYIYYLILTYGNHDIIMTKVLNKEL